MASFTEHDLSSALYVVEEEAHDRFDKSLGALQKAADQIALNPTRNILRNALNRRRIDRLAREFEESSQDRDAMASMYSVGLSLNTPVYETADGSIHRWVFGSLRIDGIDIDSKDAKRMIKGKYYKIMDKVEEKARDITQKRIEREILSRAR